MVAAEPVVLAADLQAAQVVPHVAEQRSAENTVPVGVRPRVDQLLIDCLLSSGQMV